MSGDQREMTVPAQKAGTGNGAPFPAQFPPPVDPQAEFIKRGLDPEATHARAAVMPSHREVVCAVARGEADVGLASRAWAQRVGLECVPLCREAYGLLVPAGLLGDPRVVCLCAEAQSSAFRRELAAVSGYQTRRTGALTYEPPSGPRSLFVP